ncbi:MAG TPA: OsmC family protein [Holophaga sp.]|nr:OsmC family protein [Holophaga sp.]
MSEPLSTTITWRGSTADPAYGRVSELSKPGGKAPIPASATSAFGGDDACWNPEDLFAGALANCYMLTFLALAAKTRLDVRGFTGTAEAAMETVDRVSRVATVTFRPTIAVAPGTDHAKVAEMFQKAHKYCVIANSFNGRIIAEPTVVEG